MKNQFLKAKKIILKRISSKDKEELLKYNIISDDYIIFNTQAARVAELDATNIKIKDMREETNNE